MLIIKQFFFSKDPFWTLKPIFQKTFRRGFFEKGFQKTFGREF